METSPSSEISSVVKPTIEQTPFQDATMQTVLTKLCEVSDSIVPRYVSREEWTEHKKRGLLRQDREDGKTTLFIPTDLKLWEMVDVAEAVDIDTFAHKPANHGERRGKIRELGATFINVGVYLSKNLDFVEHGHDIAIATAQDFYRYGNALQTGTYEERVPLAEISENALSNKQVDAMDNWFGVVGLDHFKHPEHDRDDVGIREQTRKEMFAQFFKVADEAEKGNSSHQRAVKNVQKRYLEKTLHSPTQEMEHAILARGIEKIMTELGKDGWKDEAVRKEFLALGIDLEGTHKTLSKVLEIPLLRTKLEILRQTGDVQQIAEKEKEIALKIQKAVSTIPYEDEAETLGSFPSKIIEKQYRNCVGATLIGSGLLEEAGIRYLVGDMPLHSVMLLVASDNSVQLIDMSSDRNRELSDSDIEISGDGKKRLTIQDIVAYSHDPVGNGLQMNIASVVEELYLSGVSDQILEKLKKDFKVYTPEEGTLIQVLGNLGEILHRDGEDEIAIRTYQEALKIDREHIQINNNMALAFRSSGKYEDCISTCNFVLGLDPYNSLAYYRRGEAFLELGQYERSIEDISQGIVSDSSHADKAMGYRNIAVAYEKLGKNDKVIESFEKARELNKDYSSIYGPLGYHYTVAGRYQEAMEAFRAGQQFDNKDRLIYPNFKNVIESLQANPDKLSAFFQVVNEDPQNIEFYKKVGALLEYRFGDDEKQVRHRVYQEAVSIDPHDLEALKGLAMSCDTTGKKEEARRLYRQILAEYPNDVDTYMSLAWNLDVADTEEAIALAKRAVEVDGYSGSSYSRLINFLDIIGREEEGIDIGRKVIERADPEKDQRIITFAQNTIARLQARPHEK